MVKSESSNQRSEHRLPPSPRAAPWLIIPHGKNREFQTFFNMCDHFLNKSYEKFIPELSGKRFWQKNSHQGWLIIVCEADDDPNFNNGDCFLWNPSSLEIIMLPNLYHFNQLYGNPIKDCLLTSPPQNSSCSSSSSITSTDDDDSMVYILYYGGGSRYILIYCHPGEKQWRKYEYAEGDRDLKSMLYCKGKLYIMGWYGQILEITTPNSGTSDIDEDSISKLDTDEHSLVWSEIAGGLGYGFHSYYMESFGEIIKIDRHCIDRGDYEHFVTKILVSKLDFNSLTWEEVKFPSDHVFFIGYFDTDIGYGDTNTRLSCLASELGNLLKGGCVYFTLKCDLSVYKYDLEDESVTLSLPCPDIPTPWLSPTWLVIPTYSRVLDDSRTTTDVVLGKHEDIEKVIQATESKTNTVDKNEKERDIKKARLLVKFNDDIVWAMSRNLHTLDYIHLRAVSKNYRSLLHLRRYSSTRTAKTTHTSPWLFFPKNDRSILNFVNPMHNNENYLLSIPELLKGSRIRFSKGGWLLMSRRKILFFYNPFTKSIVRLPDMPYFDFTGISFSSLPTFSDCLVFGIDEELDGDKVRIFFIKRGDVDWSYNLYYNVHLELAPKKINMDFELTLNNPVFYQGRFYCLDNNGTLGVFKYEHPDMSSWEILSMIAPPNCGFIYNSYLVECQGELLSVLLGRLGNWVRIYRLDETKMVWVEVKHLGLHILFLSSTSCISALAPTIQMENKIYFPRLHDEGILYYSLDTGKYHSVGSCHSAKDFRDSKEKLHCSWIEPNWSETSDHHLNWLNI